MHNLQSFAKIEQRVGREVRRRKQGLDSRAKGAAVEENTWQEKARDDGKTPCSRQKVDEPNCVAVAPAPAVCVAVAPAFPVAVGAGRDYGIERDQRTHQDPSHYDDEDDDDDDVEQG